MEKKVHAWQEVARNLSLYISDNENKFMKILELSYEHLPNHLKPCFLYFGVFGEDAEIAIPRLMPLWVAEGFIKKEEQKSLEDVALEYLMQLIDRSLVLVSKQRFNGQVKMCKVHDLLREMCLRIGEKTKFLKKLKYDDASKEDDLPTLFSQVSMYWQHHLVRIDFGKSPIYTLPSGRHVRSLICDCAGSEMSTIITSSFKVLRVLILHGSYYSDCDVLIGIEHMVNLRLLEIPFELPPMKSFHKLEFLYVKNSYPVEIPDVLLTMMSLRLMDFSGRAYFSASCYRQAVQTVSNNIQSISVLEISDATDVKILRCCPNLRRAKCSLTSSLDYSLDSLNQLISLKLIMRTNGGNYSSGSFSLPLNLKKLSLVCVKMSPEQMEIIGRLLNLEVLKLKLVSFDEHEWNASSEFPQLKFLKLSDLNLKEWNASSDNFPSLEGLALQYCFSLKMIPSSFGDIPTLQKIEVHDCAKSVYESAKQIQEEQEDMGNEVLKVIISHQ